MVKLSMIKLFLACSAEWVKKGFCLIGFLVCFFSSNAQVNQVLNPSLEQYSRCPYAYDQIKFANYWSAIDTLSPDSVGLNCAPEYCNECAGTNGQVGVPLTGSYFHYPRTGKGMAEVTMYFDQSSADPNALNYLQGHLYQLLIPDTSYCVTFFVCLALGSGYAINNIGAFLDNGAIDATQTCGKPQPSHIPQIIEHNVIYDSINWTKIEGSFTAMGTEKFITLGDFAAYAQTNAVRLGAASEVIGFYLVDDVSVVKSSTPAYAGGLKYKTKYDSVFIGRNEILPDCEWYRNGVLIDTMRAGFWVKDTVNTTYVVKQDFCGNVKYDTALIVVTNLDVSSVGNEYTFKIFPNPASKEITIQTVNDRSTKILAIYDMSGRIVVRQEVGFVDGSVRVPIDLKGGIYVVELVDENGIKNIQRLSIL